MKSVVLETSDLADKDLLMRRRREQQAEQASTGFLGGIKTFPAPLRTPLKPPSHFLEEKIISFASQNLNILFLPTKTFPKPQKYMQEHDTFRELPSFYLTEGKQILR